MTPYIEPIPLGLETPKGLRDQLDHVAYANKILIQALAQLKAERDALAQRVKELENQTSQLEDRLSMAHEDVILFEDGTWKDTPPAPDEAKP